MTLDEQPCWNGELRAGAAAAFIARLTVPSHFGDGDILPVAVTAAGEDGVQLATANFDLRTVDRPWIAIDDVVWERGQARVTIRNVGATAARDVRLDGEGEILIASLAPGETHSIVVAPAVARAASLVGHDGRAVPIGWDDQAAPVAVTAQLVAAATARSGERLDVRLRITGAGAIQTLRVRPRAHAAAVYVGGSTTVNGHAVVDGIEGPPLFTRDGLALHDIPAGTFVEIALVALAAHAGRTHRRNRRRGQRQCRRRRRAQRDDRRRAAVWCASQRAAVPHRRPDGRRLQHRRAVHGRCSRPARGGRTDRHRCATGRSRFIRSRRLDPRAARSAHRRYERVSGDRRRNRCVADARCRALRRDRARAARRTRRRHDQPRSVARRAVSERDRIGRSRARCGVRRRIAKQSAASTNASS